MWHARMQKKSIWIFVKSAVYVNVTVSFQQCTDKGFLYNIHFLSFHPFFSVTGKLSTTVSLPHGMGFVGIFAVCLRSRVATWYFNLTCEVCTIFIMLVLASLALNKSCVATLLTTCSVLNWEPVMRKGRPTDQQEVGIYHQCFWQWLSFKQLLQQLLLVISFYKITPTNITIFLTKYFYKGYFCRLCTVWHSVHCSYQTQQSLLLL